MKTSRCSKFSEEDLLALALGELPAFRRAVLRRHLAHCPDCAAAASEIAAARAQTRALTPAPRLAPDALRERIWRDATISFAPTNTPRPASVGRLVLGVCAGVAVIAAVALLPGTVARPTLAFAQVEKAMSEIRTVTWEETYKNGMSFYRGGKVTFRDSERPMVYWAQFDPVRLTQVYRWGRTVHTGGGTYQIDLREGGRRGYSYYSWGIPAGTFFGAPKSQSAAESLRDALIFRLPKDSDPPRTRFGDEGDVQREPMVSAEETLDGRKVIRFESVLKIHAKPSANPEFPWLPSEEKWIFWVNPDTYRIVRRDIHYFYTNGKRQIEMTERRDNFRYNLTPPEDVFAYLPEVGSRFSFVPLPERPATPEENKGIETVVRRAFDAWNRRDKTSYADAWDFVYLSATPDGQAYHRRLQLKYVNEGKPFRKWRILSISPAFSRIDGQFIRHTAEDKFPPTEPTEYITTVYGEGTDAKGRKRKEAVQMNLRRDAADYRLIRADWDIILKRPK